MKNTHALGFGSAETFLKSKPLWNLYYEIRLWNQNQGVKVSSFPGVLFLSIPFITGCHLGQGGTDLESFQQSGIWHSWAHRCNVGCVKAGNHW